MIKKTVHPGRNSIFRPGIRGTNFSSLLALVDLSGILPFKFNFQIYIEGLRIFLPVNL